MSKNPDTFCFNNFLFKTFRSKEAYFFFRNRIEKAFFFNFRDYCFINWSNLPTPIRRDVKPRFDRKALILRNTKKIRLLFILFITFFRSFPAVYFFYWVFWWLYSIPNMILLPFLSMSFFNRKAPFNFEWVFIA